MDRLAIHPGEILGTELKAAGISTAELARQIRVPHNRISRIIIGKQAVTGDTALRLGHWFGNAPEFWLNLQTAYELRLAEGEAGQEIATLPTRQAAPPQPQQASLL